MNGWRLAAVVAAAFGGGWVLASWFALIRRDETHIHLYQRLLVADLKAQKQAEYIAHQAAQLDAYAAGADLPDEAEEYLRERGGS